MIAEAAKLLVIGMVIVYIFLLVLMLSVIVSAKLFKGSAETVPLGTKPHRPSEKKTIPVILATAVAAYKARRGE